MPNMTKEYYDVLDEINKEYKKSFICWLNLYFTILGVFAVFSIFWWLCMFIADPEKTVNYSAMNDRASGNTADLHDSV